MATTNEVEAAITRLRSARARLYDASFLRTAAVEKRSRVDATVAELNANIAAARTEVTAATAALRILLAQPET
jgi:hypothetical protein